MRLAELILASKVVTDMVGLKNSQMVKPDSISFAHSRDCIVNWSANAETTPHTEIRHHGGGLLKFALAVHGPQAKANSRLSNLPSQGKLLEAKRSG